MVCFLFLLSPRKDEISDGFQLNHHRIVEIYVLQVSCWSSVQMSTPRPALGNSPRWRDPSGWKGWRSEVVVCFKAFKAFPIGVTGLFLFCFWIRPICWTFLESRLWLFWFLCSSEPTRRDEVSPPHKYTSFALEFWKKNLDEKLRIWRRIRRCVHCCTRVMLRSPPGKGSSLQIGSLMSVGAYSMYRVVK